MIPTSKARPKVPAQREASFATYAAYTTEIATRQIPVALAAFLPGTGTLGAIDCFYHPPHMRFFVPLYAVWLVLCSLLLRIGRRGSQNHWLIPGATAFMAYTCLATCFYHLMAGRTVELLALHLLGVVVSFPFFFPAPVQGQALVATAALCGFALTLAVNGTALDPGIYWFFTLALFLACTTAGAHYLDRYRRAIFERGRAREEEAERSRVLLEIADDLNSSLEPAVVFHRITERARDATRAHWSLILRWDEERHVFRFAATDVPQRATELETIDYEPKLFPLVARLLQERTVAIVTPDDVDTNTAALLRRHGVRTMMAAALGTGDRVLGVLAVGLQSTRRFPRWAQDTFRGIAEQASIAMGNARLLEELREATRAKSDFLANMSHEIRTPLGGMLGMARLLGTGTLQERERRYVDALESCGRALKHIIDDMLDLSKIEAGKLELNDFDFSPAQLVEEVSDFFAPEAAQKDVRVARRIAPELSQCMARGDAFRVRQVLVNLVSNAVKFTHRGEIRIDATLESVGDDAMVLRFQISDTGIGIPPDVQSRLFQPFTQADPSMSRRYGGTGLGLAICKRLAAQMGGRIGMESEVGCGSTFWFTVPLKKAQPSALAGAVASGNDVTRDQQARASGQADAWRDHGCVLVVEDHPVNRLLAVEMLQQLGYRAEAVGSGIEALEAISRTTYAAILMDCQMPGLDGFETARRIRRREAGVGAWGSDPDPRPLAPGAHRIPIVAVTAQALTGDRERCLAAGMDDYLAKPVDLDQLRVILQRLLAAHSAVAQVSDVAQASTDGRSCDASRDVVLYDVIDIDNLLTRLNGKRDLLSRAIRVFLDDCPQQLADLRQAVAGRDGVTVQHLAHRLKSPLGNFGARAALELAAALEAQARVGESARFDVTYKGLEEEVSRVTQALSALTDET
jgi:signal transduction histidine kinase/DNA-binding response OmpR family regulator